MGGQDKSKGGGGKTSKKGEKKSDTNKLTPVDRTFYELTIADLNQKLSRLRTHFQVLDETNTNLNEKLIALEEDRIDVSAHLERKLAECQDIISELKERLIEITKVREKENDESQDKICELETRYKAMSDQLTSEIKLLNGKLNSLDEFRVQRDVLLAKFDDQEAELKEKDHSHKETLYNLEQQAIVEKDALKKEVERKLLQVAEDFTRSCKIRNASYTRRLIRDNIALQKELESSTRAYFHMKRKYDEREKLWRATLTEQTADNTVKEQLIRASKQKTTIIEELTTKYESLQQKTSDLQIYREKYEHVVARDTCERFREIDVAAQKRALKERIERLNEEREMLRAIAIQQAQEIRCIHGIVEQIRTTIEAAIGVVEEAQPTSVGKLSNEARGNLIATLIEIISRSICGKLADMPVALPTTIYRPGQMGFMLKTPSPSSHRTPKSLMDIFKREARFLRHSAELCKSGDSVQAQLLRDNKILPTALSYDPKSMLDIEYGAMLYYSLSHDEGVNADTGEEKLLDLPPNLSQSTAASTDIVDQKGEESTDQGGGNDNEDFDISLFY